MFERFTDRARRVVVLAQEEARITERGVIAREHILLGLIHEGEGVAAKVLADLGVTLDAAREQAQAFDGDGPTPRGNIPFDADCKRALELALREALQLGHNYIGTEHLLLGLTRDVESNTSTILTALGVELQQVRDGVIGFLVASSRQAIPRYLRSPGEGQHTYVDASLSGATVLLDVGWTLVERVVSAVLCPDCDQPHTCDRYIEVAV